MSSRGPRPGDWPEGFLDCPVLRLQVPPEATSILSFEVILHPTTVLLPPHWQGTRPLRLDPPTTISACSRGHLSRQHPETRVLLTPLWPRPLRLTRQPGRASRTDRNHSTPALSPPLPLVRGSGRRCSLGPGAPTCRPPAARATFPPWPKPRPRWPSVSCRRPEPPGMSLQGSAPRSCPGPLRPPVADRGGHTAALVPSPHTGALCEQRARAGATLTPLCQAWVPEARGRLLASGPLRPLPAAGCRF